MLESMLELWPIPSNGVRIIAGPNSTLVCRSQGLQ